MTLSFPRWPLARPPTDPRCLRRDGSRAEAGPSSRGPPTAATRRSNSRSRLGDPANYFLAPNGSFTGAGGLKLSKASVVDENRPHLAMPRRTGPPHPLRRLRHLAGGVCRDRAPHDPLLRRTAGSVLEDAAGRGAVRGRGGRVHALPIGVVCRPAGGRRAAPARRREPPCRCCRANTPRSPSASRRRPRRCPAVRRRLRRPLRQGLTIRSPRIRPAPAGRTGPPQTKKKMIPSTT